ncbi:MAG: tRNA pseudouridine(38-40) synthase TruA [Bacteroidia bacterium]|nr:tRNA pseudouridine(38-40) synthase TruA [Bacteroidia bacterium]
MPRYKLTLEYDGTRYAGWQLQKRDRTIQGTCMDACRAVAQTEHFEFYGAGRTDAGVHALGQVAHLDMPLDLPPGLLQNQLNDHLPPDISVVMAERAAPRFHARHHAVARSYVYQFSGSRRAFTKKYVWWLRDMPDLDRMRELTPLLMGMKDFRHFTNTKDESSSTLCQVQVLDILTQGELVLLHVVASHFLWKMVRRMTGLLVAAGRGEIGQQDLLSLFSSPTLTPAAYTAPALGLFLERIYYPGDEITPCRSLFA